MAAKCIKEARIPFEFYSSSAQLIQLQQQGQTISPHIHTLQSNLQSLDFHKPPTSTQIKMHFSKIAAILSFAVIAVAAPAPVAAPDAALMARTDVSTSQL